MIREAILLFSLYSTTCLSVELDESKRTLQEINSLLSSQQKINLKSSAVVQNEKPGLHDLLLKTMHDTANYFGFGTKCQNGGHKTEDNRCICPKHFKGRECETKVCLNGAKLERVTAPTVHHVCKCPFPQYIHGEHCEKVKCANNAPLITHHHNSTWVCDCSGLYIFSGQFCDEPIVAPQLVLIVIVLLFVILAAFLCKMNWFKMPNPRYVANRCATVDTWTRRPLNTLIRDPDLSYVNRRQRSANRSPHIRRVPATAYPDHVQNVVRLDTIPVFNPHMIGGVNASSDEDQVHPPPTYEKAIASPNILPPEYTPVDQSKNV